MEKINRQIIEEILIKIKPELKAKLADKPNLNLINEGLIDSFDIIQLIVKIKKVTKKKVVISDFNRNAFSSVEEIIKLCK